MPDHRSSRHREAAGQVKGPVRVEARRADEPRPVVRLGGPPRRLERIAQTRRARSARSRLAERHYDTAFAGPWLGEFGHEIMFAGIVRAQADLYEHLTVCSRPGSRALYADFADEFIGHDIECEGVLCHARSDARPDKEALRAYLPERCDAIQPRLYHPSLPARFIRYGHGPGEITGAVVFHARSRQHVPARNWQLENWERLRDIVLEQGWGTWIACVGTPDAALHVPGTVDLRPAGLQVQMDVMAAARFAIGPSSGPMHLASHCGCPHVVWCGGNNRERRDTMGRYKSLWNPFHTLAYPTECASWQPSLDNVVDWTREFLGILGSREQEVTRDRQRARVTVPSEVTGPAQAKPHIQGARPIDLGAYEPLRDEPVGIAVLTYHALDEAKRAVASIEQHAALPHITLVFDNSENYEIGEWIHRTTSGIHYVRSPYNVGCANGRNRIAEWFGSRGVRYFAVIDQDVEFVADAWDADMRAVFDAHPGTGVASWHLATRQMSPSSYSIDATGAVGEVPGMCCMYSQDCVRAICEHSESIGCPACRAWNTDMLMYRFDTLFCLLAERVGYGTRLVWPDTDKVRHRHPHQGIKRNPRWRDEQARSRRIFAEEVERHGLRLPEGMKL